MTNSKTKLDFETLARLGLVASGVVRTDAIRRGVTLPIWRDGKVQYADPKTGEVFANEPAVKPAIEDAEQQTAALGRDEDARLDALRDLGIVLPFDKSKPRLKRADND